MLSKEVQAQRLLGTLVPFVTSAAASKDGERKRLVLVDAMTDAQVSEMYTMICSAAAAGQGFGVDEYTKEEDFRRDIADGYRFAIMDKNSGQLLAAFILAVSKYSRGCHVADPFIIVRDDQRGQGLGTLCLDLCVDMAARLGFQGMYVDTFSNNRAMIRVIESFPGFRQVGCLPMGGLMTDGQVVGTVIYYKDLRSDSQEWTSVVDS
ncbi:hypothetical protein C0Q70_07903 [Pomacea canaliculata]|uniref:N-acetyltransferase domain-containing protein n=1 Tax=Pomacea canaliculata TaxID=400727 RepID=A0A2T7PGC9_POMCA|nr:uncharacterized protein LOC112562804 [Pomacea canaliculata]PVD32464.1 hypothetical protein C0Q70_07903 [Pomacea canaliculata]